MPHWVEMTRRSCLNGDLLQNYDRKTGNFSLAVYLKSHYLVFMKTKHNNGTADLPVKSPKYPEPREFMSAPEAVSALQEIYTTSTKFLLSNFQRMMAGEPVKNRYRAYYPSIQFTTTSYANVDSRLAYGHVAGPGDYFTTITRPDLFADYLKKQIELLINNHGVPVTIGISDQPMPLHFAIGEGLHIDGSIHSILNRPLRDIFDAPDLVMTDDKIANGLFEDLQDADPAAGAVHRAAHRLFPAPAGPLYGNQPVAFPELRPVHQLPVLHGRVRALCPCDAG